MISVEEETKLKRAIRILVRAEIADSWKGGGRPEDIPIIEQELKSARCRVAVLLARMRGLLVNDSDYPEEPTDH